MREGKSETMKTLES